MSSPLAPWRDASLILLALPAFILSLVPLAILYFINKGARWLLVHTRSALGLARDKAHVASQYVSLACAKIAQPFIATESTITGLHTGARALLGLIRHRESRPPLDQGAHSDTIGGTH